MEAKKGLNLLSVETEETIGIRSFLNPPPTNSVDVVDQKKELEFGIFEKTPFTDLNVIFIRREEITYPPHHVQYRMSAKRQNGGPAANVKAKG